jgi:hypothetical protein
MNDLETKLDELIARDVGLEPGELTAELLKKILAHQHESLKHQASASVFTGYLSELHTRHANEGAERLSGSLNARRKAEADKASSSDRQQVGERDSPNTVLGVELDVLVKFLLLFRDQFRKCEKATMFLEHRTDIPNIASMANQRDAIAHFRSALQADLTVKQREEQYYLAEEHIRRSIIEPYEIALRKKVDEFVPVFEDYRGKMLPLRDSVPVLQSYPSREEVDTIVREVARLRDEAREVKNRVIWDEIWEQGVEKYVVAFDMANALLNTMKDGLAEFGQVQNQGQEDENSRHTTYIKRYHELGSLVLSGEITERQKREMKLLEEILDDLEEEFYSIKSE